MAAPKLTKGVLGVAVWGALAMGVSACATDSTPADADLIAGKQMFVEKCAACHVLARADTRGTQGPNLDEAFQRAIADGFGRDAVRGAVHTQILYPARLPKSNPAYMPANLVKGKDAADVAAYVAAVVSLRGKDTGLLASAVKPAGAGKPVSAKDGVLLMPADPNGQLAYITKEAMAPAGQLEVVSKNESSVPHDIAVEGNGVNEKGEVVQSGGTSMFTTSFKPGEYAYYCTVQGHREGGMEGKLTVK